MNRSEEVALKDGILMVCPRKCLSEGIYDKARSVIAKTRDPLKGIVIDLDSCDLTCSAEVGVLSLFHADQNLSGVEFDLKNITPRGFKLFSAIGLDAYMNVDIRAPKSEAEIYEGELLVCCVDESKRCRELTLMKRRMQKAEEELKTIKRQLIHSEKISTLGQMAAGVAHEFNNLIAIMMGHVEIAQMCPDQPDLTVEAMEVVTETCNRAAGVTEALLSFSGRKTPKKERVDLSVILARQVKMLKSELMTYNVTSELKLVEGSETLMDVGQIEQVFLNLMTNAIHAMPDGGTLTVSCEVKGDQVVASVIDTGVGIPEKNLENIFSPFYTTKGALGGGSIKGTGLGLSVSQGIIASHKGHLRVESKVGAGTCFTVYLPIPANTKSVPEQAVVETEPEPRVAAKEENTGEEGESVPKCYTVLVVDDEVGIRNILKRQLASRGHIVFTAASGEEGIQVCRECKPDILLIDMLMPGMNGADALIEIRRLHSEIEVGVITGQAGKSLEAMLEMMKRTGNITLIRKPFSFKDIWGFIDSVAQA